MSPRRLCLLACILSTSLWGCGGGATDVVSTAAGLAPYEAVKGHPCDPAHYYMQCALHGQKHVGTRPVGAPTIAFGVDFAWSCPDPQGLRLSGKTFGASYLSYDTSKNWTPNCVNWYHAHGVATVPVWETSANRATQGFSAGYSDALEARRQARNLGMPDTRPMIYAVDCDCPVADIFYYFAGAVAATASQLHLSRAAAVELVNAYAGYYQVGGLFRGGVVGHRNWQTYAWSGGNWQPASIAPLEQYLNSNAVDYDRAIAPDYGQWPYQTAPVGFHCFGPGARTHAAVCRAVRPHVAALSREIGVRNTEIRHIRKRLLQTGCRAVKDVGAVDFPHFVVVRGPHHDEAYCRRWFARGSRLHARVHAAQQFIDAAVPRLYT